MALCDRAIEIRERLVIRRGGGNLADNLANCYMNKAIASAALRGNGGGGAADRAIETASGWYIRKGGGNWPIILPGATRTRPSPLS